MDCWMSTDPADKKDAGKFLDYLESTLDYKISPCVRVYELENIKKRTEDTTDALVHCICQLAWHALKGDGNDAAVEFEVQCSLICAIPDGDIKLWKELLKVTHDKGVSDLLEICCTYYAIESGVVAMQSRSPINLRSNPHSGRIAHASSTHLDVTTALLKSLSAKVVQRKDIGRPGVTPARMANPLFQWQPIKEYTWSTWKEGEEG